MSERVSRARSWAIEKHGDQKYGKGDGARPYACHLAAVAELAAPYGELAEVVAWLHDTMEDASVTEADVAAAFDGQVARLVVLLTDPEAEAKDEQKRLRNERLATLQGDDRVALVVKACDRLANLRESNKPGAANEKKLEKYRGEHPEFRTAAYREGLCEPLWKEIDEIIGPPFGR